MAHDRNKLIGLAKRLLAHNLNGTTDQADGIMVKPVADYTDNEIISSEVNKIFYDHPVPIALSAEFKENNSYKAAKVIDTPLLITRGEDGVVRTFINICKHRGAPVCPEGTGKKSKFNCTYHGWMYNNTGNLVNIFKSDTFGDIDKSKIKLTELFCEERSGFIWACLNPDIKYDLNKWMNGFDAELDDIDLENWHLFKSIKINGPMWKICWDGYTDGYHHHMVHPETVGKNTIVNLIAHDTYGPHQRFAFGLKNIDELSDIEEKDWEPENHLRLIHSVFPNSSISAIQNEHCLVSIIFPSPDLQETVTTQYILCLKEPKTKEEIKKAEEFAELSRAAIIDEDYPINFKIQESIHSKANTEFLFGKNEPIQQHYHNWIEKLCNK
ncbi:MAG: aromatic ring-hydroxylating dioxygenase subunit alpha [Hyphomicrobiales bacterium]|jgi:phenylpropionate dioxygenase-like ring-hydroxylating dioxygenase large terminal subunit|nr:aromatic ring-hydroxylating dioxygenase subunit alpha [Hyphomicrobiales bacterium]